MYIPQMYILNMRLIERNLCDEMLRRKKKEKSRESEKH